jgi:tripartite-type tricarboxylate transporter receptor subunit TctC
MRTTLGQPILVENTTGAEGTIGVGRAARSPPDGYTLSIGQVATHALNGAVYSLRYDLTSDFEPISLLVNAPVFIVTNNTVQARNLKELIAWLKVLTRLAVVVLNVCTSVVTSPPDARRMQPTTLSLWTSRPAHRG